MKTFITSAALTLLALGSGHALAQSMALKATTPATSPASAYPMAPAAGLYQALGEQAGIRALMDDFVVRLKADPRIGEQFKDTEGDHLARQLTDQVCQLAGGPCVYKGPDMKEAHANMDVTRSHFNALVEVLQTSMNARGMAFTRQNQLLALLAPMHRDVVNVR
ncbi:MAG: group 1 truncated hemoglobin [Hydrogenophaga sp.]|jgi:hemoglobin|uniref:group I truncated hemoglobin n=1 Tax=Hydrogenophaga sp. TaxID=1904254 RepID=UPI0027185DB0|nr:group 1 truncated hemoglobin [Hydrogenophaga sp.]MDO9482901.1 group 1 truncated hemoglobin [Hydrogenophaga sp.]MDP2095319.1 group 1 truncated hemoglobin [Hydrogenophaga sp.]MDP3346458.1 group 1 truncated hemoglobin [Hydrogenophaga sp.]MDP3807494.1 group 1 truncated hemoglobin [Hydrogenophaga sp.]MDP3924533.1 group 1 truncated hemoglobin [Hydrogenophaga sp.]